MVWFKVDDNLHSNRKVRKVLADDPAAMALWAVAGSWCADELTDGFVPDDQLPWLLPAGAEQLAQKLVTARLWTRVRGGFQFHQWHADGDGTKRNPTREEVESERRKKAEAGRKGGLASGKTRSTTEARASAEAPAPAKHVHAESLNPRPDPTRPDLKGGSSDRLAHPARDPGPEPPSKCDQHIDDPDPPPCGRCGERRRTHEAWEREQLRETTLRRRAEAHQQAEANAIAAANCDRCDQRGHLPGGRICNHEPEATPGASAAARQVAKAAARRPPGRDAMTELNALTADLPPLTQPPPDEPDPPLADVVQLRPPAGEP